MGGKKVPCGGQKKRCSWDEGKKGHKKMREFTGFGRHLKRSRERGEN